MNEVIKITTFLLVLLSSINIKCLAEEARKKFNVGGIKFEKPSSWTAQLSNSQFRKAQFAVNGKNGKSIDIAFFYFGSGKAGGVKANTLRWLSQFNEFPNLIHSSIKDEKINGIKVTYVTAIGTFMKGLPLQKKTMLPESQLLGAIIEGELGTVFIKAVGNKDLVKENENKFKLMISEGLKVHFKNFL